MRSAGRRLVHFDVAILPSEPVAAATHASPSFRIFLGNVREAGYRYFPSSRPTGYQAAFRAFPIVPAFAA